MGRRIRVWREGGMYHGTLQCVDRMFMLRPEPKVVNILGASLGRALAAHPVELHGMTANINHLGFVFSIGAGQVNHASRFLQLFANLASRELNRHYEREGHFWSGRARIEEIIGDNAAETMLLYDACNPVKDGLVETAQQWKGFSTSAALTRGRRLVFKYVNRSAWWKAGGGVKKNVSQKAFMKEVEVKLTPLPAWQELTEHQRQTRFRRMLRDAEEKARQERQAEGNTVIGPEEIARRGPFERPARRRRRSPQKLCHADSNADYIEYCKSWRELRTDHIRASADYRQGVLETEFPPGTFRPPLLAAA